MAVGLGIDRGRCRSRIIDKYIHAAKGIDRPARAGIRSFVRVEVSDRFNRLPACRANGADDRSGAVGVAPADRDGGALRSEEHTSELQSLMRSSYAVFCLNKKKK